MYLCVLKINKPVSYKTVLLLNMNKQLLFIVFFLFAVLFLNAQPQSSICNLGFSIEISKNKSWGYNEPVVSEVIPGSPAYEAGLRINDIILEVNGHGTYLKPMHTIMSWFNLEDEFFSIGIRNFEYSFKQMTIDKSCRDKNSINEIELAPVFSFYSLQDVQEREFVIPMKVSENTEADFFHYRTYDFAVSEGESYVLDEKINLIFKRVFDQMGLKRDTKNPDFIIQTHYSYTNNKNWHQSNVATSAGLTSWRYDLRNSRMVRIPVCDPVTPVKINEVMYFLEFGFRFYDRNYIEPGKSMLVFEAEVKEQLSDNYSLLDYLELNLPLMLLKFPYSKIADYGRYKVNLLRFNYTGIHYDVNDMQTVIYIDEDSPAAQAGIQPGDIIYEVQGHSFNHSVKSITNSYRRFIAETMKFRDKSTKYTDINGFQNAMLWDISHYYDISKAFENKRKYKSGFSYLFGFNQYVYWEDPSELIFIIKRDGDFITIPIAPDLKRFEQVKAY